MNNARCVDLYTRNSNGQVTITAFCFERSALNYARELGASEFVIAVLGRVLTWGPNTKDPVAFMQEAGA